MRRISETVSYVLETWEGQNIFSVKWQKKKKKKKKTDPHKEICAKKEEKGKDNENFARHV